MLTLNATTGSIDTTQSVDSLKARFSFSTEANGGGTVIPGSTAINSLILSANDVEININEDVLSAYDNQDLYLNYLDPTGDQISAADGVLQASSRGADTVSFRVLQIHILYQHWNAAYFLLPLTTRPTMSSGSTEQ